MAKPSGSQPKLANCKPEDVWQALKKMGGFKDKEGTKHWKVEHIVTGHCSEIPRHSPINRALLKDFVEDHLVGKCGFSEAGVYKYLRC